ncbi:hypothetical protein CC78DRAFT_535452 [Lojkania enalia]|uniref:Uncharacterized protein n=1 Tax=Lojkania enalia TaxID=147567 RepID=A0A9P4K414_9PLEO|nr:hypothetical protein CC78DRAFT_535452 [Didymosphaeria enalia]
MAAEDDLPWTTTRCNRLLRPISSRITALRKELEKARNIAREARNPPSAGVKNVPPQRTSLAQLPKPRKPRGFDKALDPDWVPGANPAAGSKRTYSGKPVKPVSERSTCSTSQPTAQPGEIAFTPLIARSSDRLQDTPQLHGSPLKRVGRKRGLDKQGQIRALNKHMPPTIGKLVEGLLDAYGNLLLATKCGEERRRKGSRSLVGTCLHKMPAYIELEEHFAEVDDEDEDEDRDVSSEIYAYLEERFEIRPSEGWQKFRQIVRAHGTSLLCDAFADGILGLETLEVITVRCLELSSWDEAEKLLWTFLPSMKPLPTPQSLQANMFLPETSRYMAIVRGFVNHSGRVQFLYDQLEYMISQELLPLEWLATECMQSHWFKIVQALSDGDPRLAGNSYRLLETAINTGIGLPDENVLEEKEIEIISKQTKPSSRKELRQALDTTFSSLLTLLSSIALVFQCQRGNNAATVPHRVNSVIDSLVVGLLKRKDVRMDLELLRPTPETMQAFAQRAMWTVLASFLIHLGRCGSSPDLIPLNNTTLMKAFDWVVTQYSWDNVDLSNIFENLPRFVSATVRCSGRPLREDGFDQLQSLVEALFAVRECRLPHKLWNLKRLALESCLEFAHITNNSRHMAYARQMEKLMSRQGHVVLTHTSNDSPSKEGGFRWEEGIGEWVACTPFVRHQDTKSLPRKPMRALKLLPTPSPSETEQEENFLTISPVDDKSSWEYDTGVSDDPFPHSSPIKAAPRNSPKRKRASSPMVVILVKRIRITPPASADVEDSPTSETGPRRSRRKKKQIKAVVSNSRGLRGKSSLSSYNEAKLAIDIEDEDELSEVPRMTGRGCRRRGRLKGSWKTSKVDDTECDSQDELSFQ